MARTRRFFNRTGRKKCPHVNTMMKKTCSGERAVCGAEEVEVVRPECGVTDWSSWSPCSQSCGSGLKVRTRLYRVNKEQQVEEECSVQLLQKSSCQGENKKYQADDNRLCSKEKEIARKGMDDKRDAMNEGFIKIEELKEVVQELENEQKTTEPAGRHFLKMEELMATERRLVIMNMMMDKRKMKQEESQKMLMQMLFNNTGKTTISKVDSVRYKI